ncbi:MULTISPECIES: hypothetical protein [Sphingobacterium]|uniref:hypothetical protein n=1 Tax=Sphingobacterium TaxID=28453 RepID=UPI002579D338|nr:MULTISPECIES: hypothetical protein [Sphingobacterium]
MEKLTAKASIQIQKPINEVFEAIVDPNKMNHYFIKSSTGRLETDKTVEWTFPEFPAGPIHISLSTGAGDFPINW